MFDEQNMHLIVAGKEPVSAATVKGIMDNLNEEEAQAVLIAAAAQDDEVNQAAAQDAGPSQAADAQDKGKGKAKEGEQVKKMRQPPAPPLKESVLGAITMVVEQGKRMYFFISPSQF